MGTYITHEGLPFHGNLKKIRIRSCRATDPSLPGFDEEQLLEITQNGEVKLTQKTPTGTEKTKTRISQADADHIFAAFSEVFASYRRERIPSVSGHWRVRLLTDDNEVYFYHGANGQDYRYHDESLTDILRQRTGMPGLFGLSVKAETKSKVKSIEISLEQTAADEVKDRYANEYGICMHDTTEWLLISSAAAAARSSTFMLHTPFFFPLYHKRQIPRTSGSELSSLLSVVVYLIGLPNSILSAHIATYGCICYTNNNR